MCSSGMLPSQITLGFSFTCVFNRLVSAKFRAELNNIEEGSLENGASQI